MQCTYMHLISLLIAPKASMPTVIFVFCLVYYTYMYMYMYHKQELHWVFFCELQL